MDAPDTTSHNPRSRTRRRSTDAVASELVTVLGDTPVALRADEPVTAALLPDIVGTRPAPATEEIAVSLLLSTRRRAGPGAPATRSTAALDAWAGGESFVVRHRASGAEAEVVGTEAVVSGGGAPLAVVRALSHLALARLLAPSGRTLLHAGGLLVASGAVVVLGPTGAGKSTVAAAALSASWGLLADDLLVARASGGSLEVAGVARPPAVPAEVVDPSLARWLAAGSTPPEDRRGRLALDPGVLRTGWFPVVGAVHVRHGDRPDGVLGGLLPSQALAPTVGAALAAWDPEGLRGWFPSAAHLSRLPTWELALGSKASTRLAGVRECLAAVAGALAPASGGAATRTDP